MKRQEKNSNQNTYRVMFLRVVASVILFPLLPLAVALNFLDAADHLSSVPGIRSSGGIISGAACVFYLGVIISLVAVGGIVATDGGSQIPEDPGPSPATTPTRTPTESPTENHPVTGTPTLSPTPSDSEIREDYEQAHQEFLDVWATAPKDHPSTPELLGTEVRPNQDALWVVFDETDVFENASRMRDEWTTIANVYLHVINNHTGTPPERMVAVGWNNTGPITYFRVETDDARAYLSGDVDYSTYYNRYFRSIRATNDAERSIARDIAEHPPDDN